MRQLTQADIVAVAEYVKDNAIIMKNDRGKEFIGLEGFNHEINGLSGRLNFGYFGLSEPVVSKARATARIVDAAKNYTPEERKALLASLAALDTPATK